MSETIDCLLLLDCCQTGIQSGVCLKESPVLVGQLLGNAVRSKIQLREHGFDVARLRGDTLMDSVVLESSVAV